MYDEKQDIPAVAKSGDLNEDLGQIEYIFSDKTGTITENVMEFAMCSVAGHLYGDIDSTETVELYETHGDFSYPDKRLLDDAKKKSETQLCLEIMALCHTVITEKDGDEIRYRASSPDEEALIIAAKCFGFKFIQSKQNQYKYTKFGEELSYTLHAINEFSSDRKRMSIVISRNDKHYVYIKGADNVLFNLAHPSQDNKILQKQLHNMSVNGLRTLVLGFRELTTEELVYFNRRYQNAKNAIHNREKLLQEVANLVENNLTIVGGTGIRDSIQEGVADTIATLIKSGVNIWVLTGDKRETAINVGYSVKMLTPDTVQMVLEANNTQQAKYLLREYLKHYIYKPKEE